MNAGQIYVTLGRLERAGLVTSERAAGLLERPDRKVYALTATGEQRIADWLSDVTWPGPAAAEFHLKLVAAAASRLADPVSIVDAQRRELLRRLREAQRACRAWCSAFPLGSSWSRPLATGRRSPFLASAGCCSSC